jgi:hypothetical protein
MDAQGQPQAAQRHVEPMTYLDHWALRTFSEDAGLSGRFRAALDTRGGTLAVSWINLGEFAKVSSAASTQQAEDFLEDLLPHLFFLDADPFKVIQREDALLSGTTVLPHADQELLAEVMKLKCAGVMPITTRGLLDGIYGSVLVQRGDALADTWVNRVVSLRSQYATDRAFRDSVRTAPRSASIPWATRFIVRELVAGLLINRGTNLTRNDAFDWFHTVVPLAYCHAALLDGHWARQAEIATEKLRAAGSTAPLASVFSGRDNGVERFLRHVEGHS